MRQRVHRSPNAIVAAFTFAAIFVLSPVARADAPFYNEVAVSGGFVGTYCSMALDGQANPHIVYWDLSNQLLKYVFRKGNVWTQEVIQGAGFVGNETSIGIDHQGRPQVSWHNFSSLSQENLYYAVRTGTNTWAVELVDNTALKQGRYNSIILDDNDNPHISYYDDTNNNLKYATKSGGWTIETADASAPSVGLYSSIALDRQGRPMIAYYDGDNGDLYTAYRDFGGTWTIVLEDATSGQHTSIAIDGDGNLHISYYDHVSNNGDPRYRFRELGGGAYSTSIEVGNNNSGWYTSLEVDAQGIPHVSYYDVNNTVLAYVVQNGVNWDYQAVDQDGDVGEYTSLELDRYGNPYIAYHDATNGDLKFADSGIHITSPVAGDTWPVGSLQMIEWEGFGEIDVSLSVDGGSTYRLLENDVQGGHPGGRYALRVPHSPSRFCVVKLERDALPGPKAITFNDSLFTIEASVSLLNFTISLASAGPGLDVSWATDPGPDDLAGYRLDKRTGSDGWRTLVALTKESIYTDPAGGAGDTYRLFAVNGLGEEYFLGEASDGRPPQPGAALRVWPVPFRGGELSISFATSSLGGEPLSTKVAVYDVGGRLVRRIVEGKFGSDLQVATWDGRDTTGRLVPSGVYFVRVANGLATHTAKFTVVR